MARVLKEDKRIVWGIWAFTAVVWALVIILHELPQANGMPEWMRNAPRFHAFLNGACGILLIGSLVAIKKKQIGRHQRLNTLAMVCSLIFLLSYVVFHYFSGDTSYGGEYKGFYLFILITHVVLAGLSLPFILLAYYRGLTRTIDKHKRIVRFTYPVWLYVCITGVMVYLFLSPYYAY